jgi:hypothetical protein
VVWTGFVWLRTGTICGNCEHGNEPSGSTKYWEVPELAAQLAASQEGLGSK